MTAPDPTRPRVVVGVDGSDASIAALAFAAEEAKLRGGTLQVVSAYVSATMFGASVPAGYIEALEEAAHEIVDKAVAAVPGMAEVDVTRTIVPEAPVAALLDA